MPRETRQRSAEVLGGGERMAGRRAGQLEGTGYLGEKESEDPLPSEGEGHRATE